jgi:hypothetical protein
MMARTEERRRHGWKQPEVGDERGKRAEWAAQAGRPAGPIRVFRARRGRRV